MKQEQPPKWATVYTGTSVENYKTCAYEKNGAVIFDKSRESKHARKELHPTTLFDQAAEFAYLLCQNLGISGIEHHPLIIEGYLPNDDNLTVYMERNLPVRKLWIPKEGVDLSDWRQRRPDNFDEIEPLELLVKIN